MASWQNSWIFLIAGIFAPPFATTAPDVEEKQ